MLLDQIYTAVVVSALISLVAANWVVLAWAIKKFNSLH